MKFILIVIITIVSPLTGEKKNSFELRISQESKIECLKLAKRFKFSLPIISVDAKCKLKNLHNRPSIKSILEKKV